MQDDLRAALLGAKVDVRIVAFLDELSAQHSLVPYDGSSSDETGYVAVATEPRGFVVLYVHRDAVQVSLQPETGRRFRDEQHLEASTGDTTWHVTLPADLLVDSIGHGLATRVAKQALEESFARRGRAAPTATRASRAARAPRTPRSPAAPKKVERPPAVCPGCFQVLPMTGVCDTCG
ncbi:hypothetical protein EV189_2264 [Motilibacter rhizosphaerae]|uniref:Uncharacterized protein n=1 Tax=Motilibacter rhizosphaerae TaxID=598652 RepID=A0A4Q7NPA1_9ACTN|nr:hypothetical protein [Motilibacter rhizosphaerae]RZS86848.1 hypothetical protein EV189_2264 [Motilibacter rhizosphaerae]